MAACADMNNSSPVNAHGPETNAKAAKIPNKSMLNHLAIALTRYGSIASMSGRR